MKKNAKSLISMMVGFILVLALAAGCGGQASKDDKSKAEAKWPTKQVNLVVPYDTGGTTDRVVRALAPFLQKELGVPVVVENRAGGGGLVGTKAHLQNDPADGSYIVYTLEPYLSAQVLKGAYKIDDFDYICVNYWSPQAIWVKSDSTYKTVQDLLKAIKDKPNKIKNAIIPNSWSKAVSSMLAERTGSKIKDIPYTGGGPQRMAVVSGEVDFTITEVFGTLAGAGDDMKMLCVFDKQRLPQFANVPTINEVVKEMGYSEFPALSNFRFFFVKKGFKEKYPDRWEMLVAALEKSFNNPELKEISSKQQLDLVWKGPDFAKNAVLESSQTIIKYKDDFK